MACQNDDCVANENETCTCTYCDVCGHWYDEEPCNIH